MMAAESTQPGMSLADLLQDLGAPVAEFVPQLKS